MLMQFLTDNSQPFTLVMTKIDRIKQEKEIVPKAQEIINTVMEKGQVMCSPLVHLVSAQTGFGMTELRSNCVFTLEQQKLNHHHIQQTKN